MEETFRDQSLCWKTHGGNSLKKTKALELQIREEMKKIKIKNQEIGSKIQQLLHPKD
jgi:DeoR/GlpR family transcriptional regulator of sugar metabolism